MIFRANWAFKQIVNLKSYSVHKAVLKSPLKYFMAIVMKLVPGLYKKPIELDFNNGNKIIVREFMTLYIYNEIFIDGCYDNLPVSHNNPLVIEVGANTGLFVLRTKLFYPGARMISFEPYPPNYDSLVETIRINELENVTPVKKAVADKQGTLKLFIHPSNIGGHSLFQEEASSDYVEVETTTIDVILSENNISVCDILKLDCEGAEYPILKSFTKEIAQKVRNIVYEPTRSQYSVEELNHFLEELGYSISMRHGLIVATIE